MNGHWQRLSILKRGVFLILFVFVSALKASEPKNLFIYIWYDFIPTSVIKKFEAETGISVTLDYYDSNQTLEAQLLTKNVGYDLVFPSSWPFLQRQIQKGLYQPLDKTKLPNLKNLDRDILDLLEKADPGLKYSVPYIWGLTGIGYNVDEVKAIMPDAPVDSWAILFDPSIVSKFSQCGVYLLDEAFDLFSVALVYLGFPEDTNDPEQIQMAYKLLTTIRPYVKRFDTYRATSDLANGEACIVFNWSGDIALARDRAREAKKGINIDFSIPKEGTAFWIDTAAIPIGAPHPHNAHLFLNFLMRPEIAAEISEKLSYASGNLEADNYLSEEIKYDPIIHPDKQFLKDAFMARVKDREHERLLNRLMMQLKMRRDRE